MRITGPGIWGPARNRAGAIRTLQQVPELGIDFIDTADFYDLNVSEELIRKALRPYGAVRVATKAELISLITIFARRMAIRTTGSASTHARRGGAARSVPLFRKWPVRCHRVSVNRPSTFAIFSASSVGVRTPLAKNMLANATIQRS